MICISASRFVVEGIITGTRKKYRSNSLTLPVAVHRCCVFPTMSVA